MRNNSPEMMRATWAGRRPRSRCWSRHRRYAELPGRGGGRMYRIVLAREAEVVGAIGFWERERRGEAVYETGWGVLPPYQGRGIAAAAAREVAGAAAAEGVHRHLHAYPSIGHPASNGVCRKAGFTLLGECDVEYPPGSFMRCNDWRLELRQCTARPECPGMTSGRSTRSSS